MSQTLTADERAILEGCYRCICSGCARRRELIAKALRIIDEIERLRAELAEEKRSADEECEIKYRVASQLTVANALLVEAIPANVCKADWLVRRDAHLAGQTAAPSGHYSLAELRRIVKAPEHALTGAERVVLAALREFCPVVPPLALVEDRSPEQLIADGDAEPCTNCGRIDCPDPKSVGCWEAAGMPRP
jgi:hypothetical protein